MTVKKNTEDFLSELEDYVARTLVAANVAADKANATARQLVSEFCWMFGGSVTVALTAEQQRLCERMGLDVEDFLRTAAETEELKLAALSNPSSAEVRDANGLTSGERLICQQMQLDPAEFARAKRDSGRQHEE